MKYLTGFLTALVAIAVLGLVVAFTGSYNIAATQPHSSVGRWILETAMRSSIEARAEGDEQISPSIRDQAPHDGVSHFRDTCVHCHGAPGVEPEEWAHTMRPSPPDLTETADEWTDAQLFWIVQHGIKMSGMPAFGSSHSDEDLWAIVAFVRTLPDLTPEEYQRLEQQAGSHRHGPGEDAH